jgi:lipopolysaccharide transport system ATP-binding protein
MIDNVVISIEDLSKSYLVKHNQDGGLRYTSLRDEIVKKVKTIGEVTSHIVRGKGYPALGDAEEFWALKNISLDIKEGEKFGIIGGNGAGKSTLLKILSRITEPTSGRVKIKGRVASLLEVGTGFNPELTGRENVFLNGSILGMSEKEIKRKFDEIVDFSGVEKFLDTPVKRYSSGMNVRLAFAVAAHLESEILILDEVLAVGDTKFQKKCLEKISDIGSEGRTVIYVSHNLGSLSQLCSRCIWLEKGRMLYNGKVEQCINRYLSNEFLNKESFVRSDLPSTQQKLYINSIYIQSDNEGQSNVYDNRYDLTVIVEYEVIVPGESYAIGLELTNAMGIVVFTTSTLDLRPDKELGTYTKKGSYSAKLKLPSKWFLAGQYSIRVASAVPALEMLDSFPKDLNFVIHDSSSPVAILGEGRRGVLAPKFDWFVEYKNQAAEDESCSR